MMLLCQTLAAQTSYMSYYEAKDIAGSGFAELGGKGGLLFLSKRNDLVITVNNAPSTKINVYKRADGYYAYDAAVDLSEATRTKVEVNKRGDVDNISFVVSLKPDFKQAYIIEDVEKPIRMEDITKANDVLTSDTECEVEISTSISDLQIDCPSALGAKISQKPAADKTITVTSIIIPVKPISDARERVRQKEAELKAIDDKIRAELENPTLSADETERLSISRDDTQAQLDEAIEAFGKLTHIGLFAEKTNRLDINIEDAVARKKYCWGVLLRTVEVHITDFNAKNSEGARLFALRDYDGARSNFVDASKAKDATSGQIPAVLQCIADCDSCLLYETYTKAALIRMKQLREKGTGTQAEVARYASGAAEFMRVLYNYNPCDFYAERIEKLEKIIEDLPLDFKFTVVEWLKSYAGFAEGGPMGNVEVWADYGTGVPALSDYGRDNKFKKLVSASPSRYKQLGVTGSDGTVELHLVRKHLPNGLFFRPVGYKDAAVIKYMDVKDIMRQAQGDHNKKQYRLKMYVNGK